MRTALLVVGSVLIAVGGWTAFTRAAPNDGIDHGGDPCSVAFFEALGIGSDDDDSGGAPDGSRSSELKGTIEHCEDAARRRVAAAVVLLALGVAALVGRQRVERPERAGADRVNP